MSDLLLELFSEEIPARMQEEAAISLSFLISQELDRNRISFEAKNKSFVTPRRLAVRMEGFTLTQPDISTELKGPRLDAPQQAIDGFLKKSGMKLEQLEKRDGIYVAKIHQKGRPTAEVLKEVIERILAEFPWPKSMRWGSNDAVWVRPLHSILCIFDGKVVPVEFAGIKAGNVTYGHRFLSPEAIKITKAADYESALEKAHVIADREKRKAEILKRAQAAASELGLSLRRDDDLLDEVTGLVEWPVALTGKIDNHFMGFPPDQTAWPELINKVGAESIGLPPEVLVTVMRNHQKYFAVEMQDATLANYFLITANIDASPYNSIIESGNERVLRARFSDAHFFWNHDSKKPLSQWAEGLKHVTFHAKLGTVADKVERVKKLAVELSKYVDPGLRRDDVERAAMLCKADLTTGMVGEFPELQGVMGSYYARAQGENFFVANAIRDHYKPQGPNDTVPVEPVSVCIALADKLDTLISMFAVGEKPTGSKDPFALRRAALGVIRTILENGIRLPIENLINKTTPLICQQITDIALQPSQEVVKQASQFIYNQNLVSGAGYKTTEHINNIKALLPFLHDRLIVQMKDSGIRHDVIKAVVANGDDDLVRIVACAKAVQDFLATDDGKNLLAGYKRAANIVAIEEKKDKTTYKAADLNAGVLKEKEERELAAMLDKTAGGIKSALDKENFAEAMKLLSTLRAPVDLFFDKVMVNCDDKDLRAARLRLLSRIRGGMDAIADFGKIEGAAKEQKKAA